MSPASYLTAPPRVAANILAPFEPVATITAVSTWAIYGGLIVGFAAIAMAVGFLIVRLAESWREVKRLRRGLGRELNRLADLGEVTVERTAAASDTARLEASTARLAVTLARFAVLRQAIDEAEAATLGRLAAVFPRK